MKKIIFNYYGMQACCNSKFHGAGEYGKIVLKYLVENYSNKVQIAIIFNPVCEIETWLNELLEVYGIKKLEITDLKDLSKLVKDYGADILYSPTRLSSKVRTYVGGNVLIKETLHDFRGIELIDDLAMAKYMSFVTKIKNWGKAITKKIYQSYLVSETQKDIDIIDSIYCVSKHTFYSMNLFFEGLENKKIKVFYSPAKYVPKIEDYSSPLVCEKYILILGGDRWPKNPYRIILALDNVLSKQQYRAYKVVVIGKISPKIRKKIRNIDNFIFKGYVETEILERYYANCEVFVYASLNEGFGYPPIEAMKYGKTCVVSGTTSMPEICGDAVYYVNPYDVREISEKVIMALSERISEDIIKERVSFINQKQLSGLREMCEDIIHN